MVSLDTRGRGWRNVPAPIYDVALALILTILALLEAAFSMWTPFNPAVVLMTIPLAVRRRQPLLAFGVVAASAVVVFVNAPYVGVAAVMVAAYSVGAYCRYRLPSLGVVMVTVTMIVVFFHGSLPPLPSAAGPYAISISLWLIGNAIRTRQLRADAFEDRAVRLEHEQEAATRAAIAEERARHGTFRPRRPRRQPRRCAR